MEKLTTCLVCGNSEFTTELTCKDFVATNESFDITRCKKCSFLFTNPRPDSTEIGKYYQSDKYVSHAGKKEGLGIMYKIYDIVRNYNIKQKLDLIKNYHNSGKLMDLGCGLGYFLDGAVKDKTYHCVGVDVSEEAINYVKDTFGYKVFNENELDSFQENSFEVITQWHVMEHVHYLNERMIQLYKLLKPDGTMFIAVPNSNSWDAKNYKEFWDGYDVPRHLYHFNQNSFKLLMEKHGFKIVETKPLLFDAPYISMRSETHKQNNLTMIRGAINGLISNNYANSNGDYSSLLFVVKKA
ncbi:MAG: class I SAM-dependent methyltransferase [Candidatus Methylacidiphilales bacterium]